MAADPDDQRDIEEGRQYQGVKELLAYTINTTPVAPSPTSPTVLVYEIEDNDVFTDVTSTVMPTNTPTIEGNVITLSHLQSLTKDKAYRVEILFVAGGNTYDHFFRVDCNR